MTAKLRIPDWLAKGVTPDYEYESFRIWKGPSIQYIQEPEWLLESCVQKGGMTLVYGEPGTGKSLITIAWANLLAAPNHREWMGFARRGQRKVLYVVGEGQRGISGRVRAWMRSVGLDPSVDEEWPGVHWVDQAVTLWRTPGSSFLQPQLDIFEHVQQHGIEVVFLDTLATTFGGGNENQQQDMNAYLEAVMRLQDMGAAVVIVHHNAKRDNEPRGSTVLKGFVDTAIRTSATIEDGRYVAGWAEQVKQKDGMPWGEKKTFTAFRDDTSLALVPSVDKTGTRLKSQILLALEQTPMMRTELYKVISGKASDKVAVVEQLLNEGILGGGNRGEALYVVTSEEVESL